jgi:spermidine/putrescine transport system substrate-binding protein
MIPSSRAAPTLRQNWGEMLTRRQLLARGAAGAVAAGWLGACSTEARRQVTFSNWPLYIDFDEETGRHPTLDRFSQERGVRVRYVEEIADYEEFYSKLRPELARGSSGGRDLIVAVDWLVARLMRQGYAQRLDWQRLPHVRANLVPHLRDPDFDPGRRHSIPWQSGQTGLIYRRDLVGGDLRAIDDLFDPRLKGKVVMLTEMRDTVGMMMLAAGRDPERDGLDAALEAVDSVERAARDGQVRRFGGIDYSKDLDTGDAWAGFGWSGDAFQLRRDNPEVRFVQPEEGFLLWTDNLVIPTGAPQPRLAHALIDFYYRPDVQVLVTDEVHYVPPVRGVARLRPDLVGDPLVFPGADRLARARTFRSLEPEEERELSAAFQRAIGA